MSFTLAQLGVRINRKKLLQTVVDLIESRRYWQAVSDGIVESHDPKAIRTELYQKLAASNDCELVQLAQQLLTLNDIGKLSTQKYERIQALKTTVEAAEVA